MLLKVHDIFDYYSLKSGQLKMDKREFELQQIV